MFIMQLACKAMCKMLISIENGYELETMQNEVARLGEAMLALPVRLPWTRFYKGLQVNIILPHLKSPKKKTTINIIYYKIN